MKSVMWCSALRSLVAGLVVATWLIGSEAPVSALSPSHVVAHYFVRPTTGQIGATATVLVMDVSGSMSDPDASGMAKIDAAKRAAGDFLSFIGEENVAGAIDHQAGLVVFANQATIVSALSSDIPALQSAVVGLFPEGGTNIGDGLERALDLLETTRPQVKRYIILLSDGIANQGLRTSEEFLAGPVARARSLGVCISSIGFGEGGEMNLELLRVISEGSGCGKAYLARDWYELQSVYLKARYEGMDAQYQEWSGVIQQGEEKLVGDYDVPPNQELLDISLLWPGSRLELKIQDPAGTEVTDAYPGANILRHSNRMRVIISGLRSGPWKIHVRGVEVPTGTTSFIVMGSGRLTLITPTPTFTPTTIPSPTPTWTSTPSPVPTPTPTFTPTTIPSPTPTWTSTPSPVPTPTPTPLPPYPPPSGAGLLLVFLGLATVGISTGVISWAVRRHAHTQPWLELRLPNGQIHRVPLARLPFRIGSAFDNDWVLNDPEVAPYHAIILFKAGQYSILSLAGTKGVLVNDALVRSAILPRNARVQIGRTNFVFRIG